MTKSDPPIPNKEHDAETKKFRFRTIVFVLIFFFGYGGFKFYQVSTALNVWKQQTSGASHRGAIPPIR